MARRRFEFEEGGSSKFWEVEVGGSDLTVCFGRIGTGGQTKTKSFPSPAAAQKEADKLIGEKTRKGYAEMGGGEAAPAASAPASSSASPASPAPKATRSPAPVAAAPAPASSAAPAAPATISGPKTAGAATARSGPSIVIDGEPVSFAPPDWVHEHAEPTLDQRLSKRRALPFEKVWEALLKVNVAWSAATTNVHRNYTWNDQDPALTPEERALGARVRARLDRKEQGEGFDMELEAATYAVSGLVSAGTDDWMAQPGRAVWHWAERVGVEKAIETLLLGRRFRFATGGKDAKWPRPLGLVMPAAGPATSPIHGRELGVLRDALRVAGKEALEPLLRRELESTNPFLRAQLAWLLDDAEEAARAVAAVQNDQERRTVVSVLPLVEDASVAAELLPFAYSDGPVVRAVLRHGLALAPAAMARLPADPDNQRRWAIALACYPSMAAARLLVPLLEKKPNRKLVGDALANMPAEAVRALEEAKGKRVKYKDAIDALLSTLSASLGAAGGGTSEAEALPEAPADALPPVLRDPPWRRKKKSADVVVEGLAPRSHPYALDLSSLDPAALESSARRARTWARYSAKEVLSGLASGRLTGADRVLGMSLEDLEKLRVAGALPRLDGKWWSGTDTYMPGLPALLRVHGVEGVPALLALAPALKASLACGLEHVGAVEIAPLAIGWLSHKGSRKAADAWARRFPRHAAAGLVPLVLAKPGPARDRAIVLLGAAAAAGGRELVLEEARAHGPEVEAAIATLLDRDPLELAPSKPPKLPDGLEHVARPRLLDGGALSADATQLVMEMLAFSSLEMPYVGLEQVKAACDPRSLDAFVESLVRAWIAGGMASAHEWMVRSVALLGTDAAARFLYERCRAWAQDNAKQRAMLALEVLGAMGSDLALSLVGRVSRSGQRQYLKDRAVEILAEIADARGLSPDELEDRTAPDLGLDASGTLVLDFGPRSFRVGFDEHLSPYVRTAEGERLDALPRAQKTDEAAKAKAASEAWKTLKSEAEKVARDQIARLERMMADERRVEPEIFFDAFVRHPLVGHLATRLVWGAFDGAGQLLSTFRVAEDRSLATVDDDAYELPADARVGVVHPYALAGAPELVARWGEVLSSYELLQPFAQLARPTTTLTSSQLLERISGKRTPSAMIYGLRAHGWRADADESGIHAMEREIGGTRFTLHLSPSLASGQSAMHELSLSSSTDTSKKGPTPVQLAELAFQLDALVR